MAAPTRHRSARTAHDTDRGELRRRPRRTRVAAALLAVFVLVSGLAAGLVADGDGVSPGAEAEQPPAEPTVQTVPSPEDIDRVGSREIDGAPVTIASGLVPASYRIEYRVETYAGGDDVVSTEVLEVERPFLSRVELRRGPPPGDHLLSSRTASFARFRISSGEQSSVLAVPPALAASDLRVDVALPTAVDRGLVEVREQREVAGRRCQIHRAGGPASTGELIPRGAVEGEYADLCVDAAGLLLEELWVQDGEVLRRRVAVEAELAPTFSRDHFTVGAPDPISFEDGGGSTRPVDPTTRPAAGFTWELPEELPEALDDFERLGRYAVVPPRLEQQLDPADPNRRRTAGVVDVWVRGIDTVFVDQGGVRGSEPAFDPHPHGEEVELGRLDLGEQFLDLRANEVRTAHTDGSFVRVYGTLPLAELVEVARSLRPAEGEGLRYLDEGHG